jgi:hypothetical protein
MAVLASWVRVFIAARGVGTGHGVGGTGGIVAGDDLQRAVVIPAIVATSSVALL